MYIRAYDTINPAIYFFKDVFVPAIIIHCHGSVGDWLLVIGTCQNWPREVTVMNYLHVSFDVYLCWTVLRCRLIGTRSTLSWRIRTSPCEMTRRNSTRKMRSWICRSKNWRITTTSSKKRRVAFITLSSIHSVDQLPSKWYMINRLLFPLISSSYLQRLAKIDNLFLAEAQLTSWDSSAGPQNAAERTYWYERGGTSPRKGPSVRCWSGQPSTTTNWTRGSCPWTWSCWRRKGKQTEPYDYKLTSELFKHCI